MPDSSPLTSRTRAVVLLIVALASVPSCGRGVAGPDDGSDIATLAIAGAVNSGASLAAHGSNVVVTWAATTDNRTDIYAAVSANSGRTFSAPVRVNNVAGDARVTGEQPPRVAMTASAIAVVWQSKVDDVSVVRSATSSDGGRTFAPAITVNRKDVTAPRGWASIAMDASARARVLWLDARTDAPAAAPTAPHVHGSGGGMEQSVFFATPGAPDARIAHGACFCCKTAIAIAPNGAIYAAWRHIYPVNLRDMAMAVSTDDGRTFGAPVRVSEDHWQIAGCPEDGPSLAVDARGVVHISWPTFIPETGRKAIFYSYSTDGGRTFARRLRVDADARATAAHPTLAVDGDRVVIVWDETIDTATRVRSRAFVADDARKAWWPERTAPYVSASKDVAEYPSVAFSGRHEVVAWTEIDADRSSVVRLALKN